MGGVAGHLAHLYDNRDLTYNEMADILQKAAAGELIGTEKTDGYNIYLGYVGGKPRAARNKGDMARGGMSLEDLVAREFKGGDKVKKAYLDAFKSYTAALESLSDNMLASIFGEDGEIFYNTEIQGPAAANAVNYDENVLNIHRMGHKKYNKDTNQLEIAKTEEQSKALDSGINRFESEMADVPFRVRRTAYINLNKITNDEFLNRALSEIREAGFYGGMTINDFLKAKISPLLDSSLPFLYEESREPLMRRILGIPNRSGSVPTLNQITKGMSKEEKRDISSFVKKSKDLIKEAIWPIELAIHDFAVELLKGLKSAYILDAEGNEKEVERLKKETEEAIRKIKAYDGPDSDAAHEILLKQLKKLKHHDNINTVVEGFVFQIGDQMYKFTGNFAPMNQLLGLFRYGRGKIKPMSLKEGEHQEKKKTALIPGGFKPPHRGHLALVTHYLNKVGDSGKVLIYMGSGGKSPRTIGGKPVTFENAYEIWRLYLENEGFSLGDKVEIVKSEGAPIAPVIDYVTATNPDEETIFLGAGEKDGQRWKFMLDNPKYNPNGVEVIIDAAPNYVDADGNPMSATNFRKAIESGNKKLIKSYIPFNSEGNYDDIMAILKGEDLKEAHTFMGIFHGLIEDILAEKKDSVNKKIKILKDEGYDQDQAVAIALSMEERGELNEAFSADYSEKESREYLFDEQYEEAVDKSQYKQKYYDLFIAQQDAKKMLDTLNKSFPDWKKEAALPSEFDDIEEKLYKDDLWNVVKDTKISDGDITYKEILNKKAFANATRENARWIQGPKKMLQDEEKIYGGRERNAETYPFEKRAVWAWSIEGRGNYLGFSPRDMVKASERYIYRYAKYYIKYFMEELFEVVDNTIKDLDAYASYLSDVWYKLSGTSPERKEELEETSAMAMAAVHGPSSPKKNKNDELDKMVNEVYDYLLETFHIQGASDD